MLQVFLINMALNLFMLAPIVFNGNDGPYEEDSMKNEINYYGLSKNLGEVINYKNSLTIRTSIIGPEIRTTKTESL